ncbi:FRG domain-containing protein [Ezakiella coagulans]|uniref:FRG domain-containing protein n=1 Tax=Ezakiella coagulans TaxID=46507 RepID=UPI002889D9C0|nr:FRG domain-containing protein [Ezakiella coagulans]
MANDIVEKIEIKKLSEFIALLENGSYENMYFRGQPRDYSQEEPYPDSGIVASCYRNQFKHNSNADLNNMLHDYYFNLGHLLTETDKNNFLAYAQHHGLPTNLIDISSVSLVALYFACEKTYYDDNKEVSQKRENDGHVYALQKDRFINISNQVSSRRIDSFYNDLVQEGLYSGEDKATLILFNNILKHYLEINRRNFIDLFVENVVLTKEIIETNKKKFEEDHSPLIDKLNFYIEETYNSEPIYSVFSAKKNIATVIIERELRRDKLSYLYNYAEWLRIIMEHILVKLYPEIEWYTEEESTIEEIKYYGIKYKFNYEKIQDMSGEEIISVCFLTFFIFLLDRVALSETVKMPRFPYMLYKPEINFDRIRLQSGHFIYQNALYYLDNLKCEDVIINDSIRPDKIIIIKNKNKNQILKELDNIGINKMTLFEDPDKYAEYLKEKYQKNSFKLGGF